MPTAYFQEPCIETSAPGVDAEFIKDDMIDLNDKMKNFVVGFFLGGIPNFYVARAALQREWNSKRGFEKQTLDKGFFLFNFKDFDESQRILENGPWYAGQPIVLQR